MRTILVVDDEYLVRVGIHSFLNWEEHGYTIIGEAADGQAALDIIEKAHPDIVLTDLKMDGMDGFALIETCKKSGRIFCLSYSAVMMMEPMLSVP